MVQKIQPTIAAAKATTAAAPQAYKKKKIPKAIREALWIDYYTNRFEGKCQTVWCPNKITAYDFQAGHNVPESKGGATTLENLVPICARCNLSMGNQYTFNEWCDMGGPVRRTWLEWLKTLLCCPVAIYQPPLEVSVSNPSKK